MSSLPTHNGWLGDTFSYAYDHAQFAPRDVYGASTSHSHPHSHSQPPPQSRSVSRPRVNMACKHCRQRCVFSPARRHGCMHFILTQIDIFGANRKVRCDGQKPKCSLCTRLKRPCDYVKVTEEENAVLRDKKRRSKQRKTAEQEAARANLNNHDAFPAYHPYRGVPAAAHAGSSFDAEVPRSNEQRIGLHAPPLPAVSTAGFATTQPFAYDTRYPSTSTAANALFDVGAGLTGSRRQSTTTLMGARAYSRKPDYARAGEPRPRACEPVVGALAETSSFAGGLGLSMMHGQTGGPAFDTHDYMAVASGPAGYGSFRAFANEANAAERLAPRYSAPFGAQPDAVASPYTPQPGELRATPAPFESAVSVSPTAGSPTFGVAVPPLERASSSAGSGASASPASHGPEATPHQELASLWADARPPTYGQDHFRGAYDANPVYAEHNTHADWAAHKKWDPTLTLYVHPAL